MDPLKVHLKDKVLHESAALTCKHPDPPSVAQPAVFTSDKGVGGNPLRLPYGSLTPDKVDRIEDALRLLDGGMSVREASKLCRVPRTSLTTYRSKGYIGKCRTGSKIFRWHVELELVEHILNMSTLGLDLSRPQLLDISKDMAEVLGVNRQPTVKWYRLFRKRHNLPTKPFKKVERKEVDAYYSQLWELVKEKGRIVEEDLTFIPPGSEHQKKAALEMAKEMCRFREAIQQADNSGANRSLPVVVGGVFQQIGQRPPVSKLTETVPPVANSCSNANSHHVSSENENIKLKYKTSEVNKEENMKLKYKKEKHVKLKRKTIRNLLHLKKHKTGEVNKEAVPSSKEMLISFKLEPDFDDDNGLPGIFDF